MKVTDVRNGKPSEDGKDDVAEAGRQELSIKDYVALLRRRKWIVVAMVVLVPVCAAVLSMRQHPVYQSTATVALREGDLAATVSGIADNSYYADPNRLAATQIALAETPSVAAQVLKRAKVANGNSGALLGSTAITANPNADLLYFTVKNGDPTWRRSSRTPTPSSTRSPEPTRHADATPGATDIMKRSTS